MRKIRINIVSFLSLFLMFFLCTDALATTRVLGLKLLTSKIGWLATENNLYWTIDAGSAWHNITPQSASFGQITSVFFLNTTQGWVLCSRKVRERNMEFSIAFTNDAGVTWSIWPVKLPDKYVKAHENNQITNPFSGMGWIDFKDAIHGWIILEFPVSAKMDNSIGIMLGTEDGGKTYTLMADHTQLPTTGEFHFISTKDGWIAGRINTDLYVTRDGGATWKEVLLSPPPQVSTSGDGKYDLPIIKDSQNGFLPVTYVTGITAAFVLFVTQDGGMTWKADRVLLDMRNVYGAILSRMVDSVLITLTASDTERSLTLIKVLPGGKIIATTASALNMKGNITPHSLFLSAGWKISFITSKQGWVTTNSDQLLSTNDGGETWSVITPQ